MFIRSFSIDWDKLEDRSYVKEIPALNSLREFQFRKRITFFVGENGSGKSTLLEALAIAKGLNPEGGTRNYNFSTYDDYSTLKSAITFQSGMLKPKWSYFLRAESFYNVASEAARNYNDDGCMTDFHARSHGESFLEFILENDEKGLYFMDEPEAALSPQRQLTLLLHLVKMAEKGSQFIIVTHSPILLGTPDADIVSFDEGEMHRISYEETESYQVTKLFLENREVMLRQLLQEETECETDAKI
ncbi:MAG: AAA family ATPase [Lachnospiraceae bacterium]|nr:AAA family ATPase [Lachnospiraceae bacterium]